MMWEMLAARRMWHGMTEVEIVSFLASGRPLPPLPPDPTLPPGLEAIVARALDPDPDRRHQSAAELEMDLEGVLSGSADSHARNLGKVVAHAFSKERAERQAIIEECVRRTEALESLASLNEPRELPDAIEVSLSSFEREGAARKRLPESPAAPTPVPAPAQPSAPLPAAAPLPVHHYKLRRAATFSGLVAIVGALLLATGWRRPVDGERSATPVMGVATVQAAQLPLPSPAAPASPPRRQVIRLPAVSAGPAPEDPPPRTRPHHHAIADDGDEPMPPSIDLDRVPTATEP